MQARWLTLIVSIGLIFLVSLGLQLVLISAAPTPASGPAQMAPSSPTSSTTPTATATATPTARVLLPLVGRNFAQQPDLAVDAVFNSRCPEAPDPLLCQCIREEEPGQVVACIQNWGSASTGPFTVRINTPLHAGMLRVANLRQGRRLCIQDGPMASSAEVIVDAENQVIESREDNNVWRGAVPTAVPAPDCTPPPTATPTPTATSIPRVEDSSQNPPPWFVDPYMANVVVITLDYQTLELKQAYYTRQPPCDDRHPPADDEELRWRASGVFAGTVWWVADFYDKGTEPEPGAGPSLRPLQCAGVSLPTHSRHLRARQRRLGGTCAARSDPVGLVKG